MNAGSRVDHHQFCLIEGWEPVLNARGKKVRHHVTFELALPDGRRLRTRVSRPVDTTTYGQTLWHAILRDQLEVTQEQFWACVRDNQLPDRGTGERASRPDSLPADLVYQLIHVVGVPEEEVMGMSLEEAVARMTERWTRPPQ